jgi:uncharacterized protein YndB with AHSA1/START domain
MDSPTPPPPARRLKKRVVVPGLLLLLMLILFGWVWVRGSWADTDEQNPATSAEGTVTQLHQTPDGHKQVRCARVFDHPIEDVWRVVTDYDHFPEIFPHVVSTKAEKEGPDLYHITGTVTTPAGAWDFETRVHHKESSDDKVASWDEPGGQLTVERGRWALKRLDSGHTLLVYIQEIEVQNYPAFVVRALLRYQLPSIVEAVEKRLKSSR